MMMKKGNSAGAFIIEFALAITLLALLATAIADASAAFRVKHVLQAAAREGARKASTTQAANVTAILPVVTPVMKEIFEQSGLNFASVTSINVETLSELSGELIVNGELSVGNPIRVHVIYFYQPMILGLAAPLVPGFSGLLQSSSTMRYEGSS